MSDDQDFPPSGELLFGEDFEQVLAHQAGGVEVWGRGSGSPARAEEVWDYEREIKGQEVGEEGGPEVRAVGPAMQQEEGRGGGGRRNRGTVEVVGVEEAAVGIKGVFGERVHLWQGFACGWGTCCEMGWGGMRGEWRGGERIFVWRWVYHVSPLRGEARTYLNRRRIAFAPEAGMSCYFCRHFPSSVPPCHAGSYHQKCMFCACPASLSFGKDGYLSHPSSQSPVRGGRAGVYRRCIGMSASDDRDSTADGGLGLLVEDVVRVMHRR